MGEDSFRPTQEQVDELLTPSVVGRTANLPIASDSQNARLVAIELVCKIRFGARVEARARELQRLERKERSLEKGLQDVVNRITVEHEGMAGCVVDSRCANTGSFKGIVFRERLYVRQCAVYRCRVVIELEEFMARPGCEHLLFVQ